MKTKTVRAIVSSMALSLALAASPAIAEDVEQKPTPEDAREFMKNAEADLLDLAVKSGRAEWVYANFITEDTEKLTAEAGARYTEKAVAIAIEAAKMAKIDGLDPGTARKLSMVRTSFATPAPVAPGGADAVATLTAKMQGIYGKGQATVGGQPISGNDVENRMLTERDPALLKEMWASWHDNVGTPMKDDYAKFVELANQGARDLGFADAGALWRSNYDMSPEDFAALTERLWQEVKPLYNELHCYTRTKLNEKYGDEVQAATGPIRADLLGNMWAQQWSTIYDIVAPEGSGDIGYDLTSLLVKNGYDAHKMAKAGENFFSSLGFDPLPETFWTRSLFVKPADREVVCHASAWDIDFKDDLRVKMCTKINATDFDTWHHELGHNYYQRAYNNLDFTYQNGANDGFHEAIGDFITLSITPEYLVQIGLLKRSEVPSADKDIGLLLEKSLDKVAFLPFGLLIDRWRWGVFDGSITPDKYTSEWVRLKKEYQGIVPPVVRTSANFDPGAKYHVPANVPYTRYFLSFILQFQFYEAACKMAGWKGPLHRCSFYGNKKVGEKFNKMLEMGASKPWPDALEAFTGTREMSGKSLIKYFAPLSAWLKKQNAGKKCGW
ncbi:MAG: M2 family metallopeptidase [Novosphingobium sp.]|nr:M2 family metallopeptidase [Novosphingobium sp.]